MSQFSYDALRYDHAIRKHTHNSYQKHESLFDQALFNMIRSFELDIHRTKSGDTLTDPIDWWVFHEDGQKGETSCKTLGDGLARIAAVRAVIPRHEVITVWIEFKENVFDGTVHTPASFDDLLARKIAAGDRGLILTPASMSSRSEWPTLRELRGRYVFVLLGNDGALSTYAAHGGRLAFLQNETVAGQGGAKFGFNGTGDGFVDRAPRVNSAGDWQRELRKGTQFIGTDMVDEHKDNWSFTHNAWAWPFAVDAQPSDEYVEDAESPRPVAMMVQSGDLWSRADSCFFLYEDVSAAAGGEVALAGYVSFQQGDSWAKGSFMARAGTAPDAPYLAVCRPVGNHAAQIQFRRKRGGETERYVIPTDGTVGRIANQHAFGRITLRNGLREAHGFAALPSVAPDTASADGGGCTIVFDEPLTLVGVAGSSHGEAPYACFTFGALALTVAGAARALTAASLQQARVGSGVAIAAAQDGVLIGTALQNVNKQGWESQYRALATLRRDPHGLYLANYRASDGQISIDVLAREQNTFTLDNVFQTRWAAAARSLASLSLDGGQTYPFLANFRGDTGQISIDQLTRKDGRFVLANVYKDEWAKEPRALASLWSGASGFLANYRRSKGQISIDQLRLESDGRYALDNVCQDQWDVADRVLTGFNLAGEAHLANYRPDTGQVSIDRLVRRKDGSYGMENVYRASWLVGERCLASLCVGDGAAYLVNVRFETGRVSVDRVEKTTGGGYAVQNVLLDTWATGLRSLAAWSAVGAQYAGWLANFRSGDISIDRCVRYPSAASGA